MRELCKEASTIVIVSHALASLNELCDTAVWINKGKLLAQGKPSEITDQYLTFLNAGKLPFSYEDL
jgi:ABC-type polysaccharide/polyol phosphate transport system ATPase subunit